MKVSFFVLTYNRSDALLAVLRSLSVQCAASHEVLIADDGSSPEQVNMLVQQCPAFKCPVRHVWHPDVGFTAARARNLAASRATGDYLVFLDGDCVPNRSFVTQHMRLAEAGCFVNGSRVLLGENLTRQVTNGTIDLLRLSVRFWLAARIRGDSNKILHLLVWPWRLFRVKQGFQWRGIRSCNLGVWRSDFFAVNGFDEVFEGWGHEDADLVLRLSHLGVKRKNGFLATEVFHLWHRENKRSEESVNRNRVLQRMTTDLTRAEKGLEELDPRMPIKITQLQ
ncbi:MAG: glycosyltransferase family 2 protein [Polaromonas sp.]